MENLAGRIRHIQPFHVMEILARAKALQACGRDIVHLEVGEPDFMSPQTVVQAGVRALQQGKTRYTPALGIPELRQAVADYYLASCRVAVKPENVVITTGSSAALLLIMAMLIDAGDEVILSDPGYPCYRHYAYLYDGVPVSVAVEPDSRFQLTAELVDRQRTPRTKAIMLSSPGNPTGTVIPDSQLQALISLASQHNIFLIVDEIYQGLTYGQSRASALQYSSDIIVINSFSKYFGMTGWRLGWCVLPDHLVGTVDKLAQNFFLSPPACSQYAALAAFEPETLEELEDRRRQLQQRRDFLLPQLQRLGFDIPATPDGAFYIYADCSRLSQDSRMFTDQLLEQAGVAITPGLDFGSYRAESYVRIAYTQKIAILENAVSRIEQFLRRQHG